MLKFNIPTDVSRVTQTLQKAGFQAYLVGGCVRELLREEKPKDWDITTSGKPEDIERLFPKTFYENKFGTVTVVNEDAKDETLRNIEVTPFRLEAKYSDKRHPDSVAFSNTIEDDLKRRDFTMNALAYDPSQGQLIDLYNGEKDIKDKTIKAVGNPEERFDEDPLRIMRAIRFTAQLGFTCNTETAKAIEKLAHLLKKISTERIRDEFIKILMSDRAMEGVQLMHDLGVLSHVLPELEEGLGIEQNGDHIYVVWEHNLRALNHAVNRKWPLHIRIGALLHDVGKPKTRQWSAEKNDWTFYGHDVVGGKMAERILTRLKFPNKTTEVVAKLVRHHLFFTDIDKITLSAVRRLVRNVGEENVWDLMKIRACDRIGMGRPKEKPYRLRKYEAMIEEAMRAPTSVQMLKLDGERLMKITDLKPGREIGFILHALLEEALDDPKINTEEYLEKRARELAELSPKALAELGERGKQKKEAVEEKEVKKIRERHWVN